MKLKFLGTRGYIDSRTQSHYMHSALMVTYRGRRVMVDCGEDWLGKVDGVGPGAIVVTHSHPDHVWGLKNGAPCPVYASMEAWEAMKDFEIEDRITIEHRTPVEILGITFEAFPVDHSTRSPAVGFRITAGGNAVFYVPDVVYIPDRKEAFSGIKIYIGDGATLTRSMVRKSEDALIGHTPIRTQLTWCRKEEVSRAIFTHCGSAIVDSDEKEVAEKIRELGSERGVDADIAYDGMELVLR